LALAALILFAAVIRRECRRSGEEANQQAETEHNLTELFHLNFSISDFLN